MSAQEGERDNLSEYELLYAELHITRRELKSERERAERAEELAETFKLVMLRLEGEVERQEERIEQLEREIEANDPAYTAIHERAERLEEALRKIADPEWGAIYPADVFAETKQIARRALNPPTEAEEE